MKSCFSCLLLFYSVIAIGQRKIEPTESFKVTGKIKSEKVFTLQQLDSFLKQTLNDQILYNHNGEAKDTVRNLKGTLLKSVLAKIGFVYEKPKELNEFYFVLTASDGYKVVFSWNEIYNTGVGDGLFVITELEGKSLRDIPQRIIVASAADTKPGRRYIKGLQKIEIKKAE